MNAGANLALTWRFSNSNGIGLMKPTVKMEVGSQIDSVSIKNNKKKS